MKFKLNFEVKLLKDERKGVRFKLNGKSFELRSREEYEKREVRDGRVIWEGEPSHGFRSERNGIYKSAFLNLPFNLCVDLTKDEISYAEAVDIQELDLDYMLDEFDHAFNTLAVGSMRYHMDYSVAECSAEMREKYEDIISRLEGLPYDSSEELEHYKVCKSFNSEDILNNLGNCDVCSSFGERRREYRNKNHDYVQEARKDFMDIAPTLWS